MTDAVERSQPPFQLRKIGHIVLNCTDIDASVRFYTQVLGLEESPWWVAPILGRETS
ncbi:MAG: Glyoxalase [Chloroflexi bacterium]|nr:Glyoxalase [Chloroflexota bacterium]